MTTDCPICDQDVLVRIGPLVPDVDVYDVEGSAIVHLGEDDGERYAWVHQRQATISDF